MKLSILYEDNHLLVIEKPINLPVQEDASQDPDLLNLLKRYLKETYQKPGNVYLGLVHRLDRPVGGVMVFAKTSKAAARLAKQVQSHTMQKTYLAICTQAQTLPIKQIYSDYLLKDRAANRVNVVSSATPGAKYAELSYQTLASHQDLALVRIQLKTGRSHQIRVQFASRHHALWGDQRYNSLAKPKQQIALFAYQLQFEHPVTHTVMCFTAMPKGHPWEVFATCLSASDCSAQVSSFSF